MGRKNGTIKSYNFNEGYGFITAEDETELFVSYRSIEGNGYAVLREGQKVSFDVETGQNGLEAVRVRVLD
ncbi:cold-shock protein [Priestia megaterium]|nr:cold shock domain-containing protein [Priestia megaterium]MDH6651125.1 CspA family cold shock protein [Bacillus sp. PvP124]PEA35415.1 cold-shock protein [Priestia megaterium]PEE45160.1 cold-shock protein [Priestia megaterium]PFK47210.1 cold-shock protein [Priestia megaterium]PFP06447.1 cold-shock protein [Priestia megaterium]